MSLINKIKYPIAMQWKVSKAPLQGLRSSINGYVMSVKCDVAGTDVRCYFTLNPNGDDDRSRGQAWIYLHLEFSGKKSIFTEYTIAIESANFSKKVSDIYEETFGCGHFLCKTEELYDPKNGFIVSGEMIVTINGFFMIEKDAPVKSNQLSWDTDSFCVNLWNQDTKDFTIVADGKEISAHKIILSARSPVFQAMFQPHTKEAQENRVVIPDFSFKIVEAAIKLCYHSSLIGHLSFEDQLSVLQFFDKYDVQELKEKLEKYLISELNETNVCGLYNGSVLSNASNLRTMCTEFLQHCLHARKPVTQLDILDKEVALDLFKKAFYSIV